MLASLLLPLAAAARPTQPFAAAAVFPLWWSRQRVETAVADLAMTARPGRLPAVINVTGGATLHHQLREAGAWILLDPRLVTCAS
ncbi:hypothetical protein IFJ75_04780 [Brevundimonas goettingensis]|jgi:hypothetical protein|uniref:Uncharacterized protein n=2 Tax=Brevundimonas goettingensis TaxID=2774190 RepID=A0A975C1P6_9CAUL|nr:hypothetical protein IFJ75_04780 [Brevundimonas goettingensis]